MTVAHPLDNPVLSSLTGAHARFAERRGHVLRYQVDVSPFLAMPDQPSLFGGRNYYGGGDNFFSRLFGGFASAPPPQHAAWPAL